MSSTAAVVAAARGALLRGRAAAWLRHSRASARARGLALAGSRVARFDDPAQFSEIIVKAQNNDGGRLVKIKDIARGGYILRDPQSRKIDAVMIATGSEITLALQAAERLEKESGGKFGIRVVSMPSTTVFDQQDAAYKAKVLPAKIPRIAVEAGVSDFWWKYGCAAVHGVDTFGESAPAGQLYEYFGLTVDQISKTVKQCISKK